MEQRGRKGRGSVRDSSGKGGGRTRDNEIDRLDRCEGGRGDLLLGLFVMCWLTSLFFTIKFHENI